MGESEGKPKRYSLKYSFEVGDVTEPYVYLPVLAVTASENVPAGTEDPVAYLRARLRKEFNRKVEEFTAATNGEESI